MKFAALTIILSILIISCLTTVWGETQVLTSENFFDKIKEGDWFIKL